VVADDDVVVSGTPKDYLDRKTDSGTDLHRWFCGDCGRSVPEPATHSSITPGD
jgi:hypothetical protein